MEQAAMESASLEELLSHILIPDNVVRTSAERELERRSGTVPGFCASLADFCRQVAGRSTQQRLALVAFAVLKRGISQSLNCQEVQHVVSLFLGHLGDLSVVHDVAATTVRQWTSVVATGVRRLAVLRGPAASAGAGPDTTAAAACFEAATNAITAQLLHTFALFAQVDERGLCVVYTHLTMLQTFFEGSFADVVPEWCAELVASCAAPLFEILCTMASTTTQAAEVPCSPRGLQMRCATQSLVAEALVGLYEWQFAASRRELFPMDLKHAFLEALSSLQTYVLLPCAQWAASPALGIPIAARQQEQQLGESLTRASPLLAAALAAQQLVVKVLQYGRWYKRFATPALLRGLLNSLEADVTFSTAALALEDDDVVAGGFAGAGPSGTLADGWVPLGDTRSMSTSAAEAAVLVRRHVTQRWTLFGDVAFLSSLKRGMVDVVGDQCGRHYYQLLLSYAVLSPGEAAAYEEDPNAFLREEGDRDDGLRGTARDTVAQLYTESIKALGPLFLHASLEDLSECLFAQCDAAAVRSSGGGSSLRRESALFFMECALRHCCPQLRECGAADFAPLAQHIWSCDVADPAAHPVTAARALMLLIAVAKFSCAAGSSMRRGSAARVATPFDAVLPTVVADGAAMLSAFAGASSSLSSPCTPLVAVALCQFLQRTLPFWPPDVLVQHFETLQASFLSFLAPQVGLSEEALYGAVEQLTDLLQAAMRVADQRTTDATARGALVSPRLPRLVMACWLQHVSDPNFADVVLRLLRLVVLDRCGEVASPALTALLEELAWVNKVLCGYADSMAEACAVPYFLRLLRSLFANATDDVANAAATLMLDSICQLLLCTEESAIVVASSSCLAAMLRRCPAAQAVQVHVVAATVEAALTGGSAASDNSVTGVSSEMIAHAPRAVYPFSTVVVAIVLRTLQDDRGEASLLEMGQTITTIVRHSTSFTKADLVRVVHATVHRLGVVRTDTVREQLLSPLATLLCLQPAALLHTLVQGGLLAETMGQWLPHLEHFTKAGVTYASCEGLLRMLELLAQPARASMSSEEAQQVAQLPVTCRWRLPENVNGYASSHGNISSSRIKRGVGKRSAASKHKSVNSGLAGGAVVETRLALYVAILIAVGRGVLTLLSAPLPVLRRASQADGAVNDGTVSDASSDEDEENDEGQGLFQESSCEEWEEEEVEDGENASHTVAAYDGGGGLGSVPSTSVDQRSQLLALMGSQLLPWMQKHGDEVTPYFTPEETELLSSFFASTAGSGSAA